MQPKVNWMDEGMEYFDEPKVKKILFVECGQDSDMRRQSVGGRYYAFTDEPELNVYDLVCTTKIISAFNCTETTLTVEIK